MNFATSLSALRSSQFALDTVAQNLANANTQGYHRQRVEFKTTPPQLLGNQYLGTGVEVGRVDRIRNQILESNYTNSISDLKNVEQKRSIDTQIENLFLPGDGSLHQGLGSFFDELTKLTTSPSENTQRNSVIQQGNQIANQIHDISNRLHSLKSSVKSQLDVEVKALNGEIKELVDLQNRIQTATVNYAVPNDLYDQRDQLINRIAEKIDVQRYENLQGGFGLSLGNSAISLAHIPVEFETAYADDGSVRIELKNTDHEIKFASGSVKSLVETHNSSTEEYQTRLDEFAKGLMRSIDQAHATGVGTTGSFEVLRSARPVKRTDLPLEVAGTAFPVEAGELYISVTDPAGEKRTYAISIDPATDSLEDIADRIDAINDVQAIVDDKNGQLSIIARPGYQFDFTGNLETIPDLSSFTGTATPRIGGEYSGNYNRELSVTMVGSGIVGKDTPLMARVTDIASGKVLAEVNVGEGYEAELPIDIADGITLTFPGGNVNDGDSFTTHLVANPDTSELLSAIGLNSFFSGSGARDIAVSRNIQENPDRLASSRSGDIADTKNLLGIVKLRDAHLNGPNKLTFEDYLTDINTELGFQVRSSQLVENNLSELKYQYETDISSVSGVDLNEELLQMTQYQKQYEAAVQVMRTMENMLDDLFSMIR